MLRIEFENPEHGSCPCCGTPQLVLTRFVYRDDIPFGIYKAVISSGAHPPIADMVVSLGDWGEDASPEQRVAFAVHLWTGSDINVGIVEPNETGWESSFWGTVLRREQALQHHWLGLVFELAEEIARFDEILMEHLERRSTN